MFDLIKEMVDLYGASGREAGVADHIEALLKDKVTSIRRDAMGNLICEKKGTDPHGKRIMLSAHMDHIGFIVVAVEEEGYLRVMPVGGISLDYSRTRHVYFGNGINGIVCQQPLKPGENAAMKHFYIDIGASDKQEALSMIQLGDIAVYSNDCFRLGAHRMASPAMDDRVACALLIRTMQELGETKDTVIAVFSTQEEVGCRGAQTAAFSVEPDIGIAIDVTSNGDTPENKLPAVRLGDGICVKIMDRGSISNPDLVNDLLQAGQQAGVKTQREVLPFGATDASAIQLSRGGVRVSTLSIPCRNVHSACEVIDLRDVEAGVALLKTYLSSRG